MSGEFRFRVNDEEAPVLAEGLGRSLSPASGAKDVRLDSDFVVTFNERVQAGSSGDVVLRGETTMDVVRIPTTNTSEVNFTSSSPYVMRVSRTESLMTAQETQVYTVEVEEGAVVDMSGNEFSGIREEDWRVEVEDLRKPMFVTRRPRNGASGVASNTRVAITFTEFVEAGTGNISFVGGGMADVSVSVSGDEVEIVENLVVIDLVGKLDAGVSGRRFNVSIPSGVIVDRSTNANVFDGYVGNEYSFVVVDEAAPVVVSQSPSHDEVNVSVGANITIVFDTMVEGGEGFIVLRPSRSGEVFEIDVKDESQVMFGSGDGKTVIIDPTGGLDSGVSGQKYRVEMESGVIQDLAGNDFFGFFVASYEFEVLDVEAPMLESESPKNGASEVSATQPITLRFNEEVKVGSGEIVLTGKSAGLEAVRILAPSENVTSNASDGKTVVIYVPSEGLPVGTTTEEEYSVEIEAGVVTDLVGNEWVGITGSETYVYSLEDSSKPELESSDPDYRGVEDVGTNKTVRVSFNEKIKVGEGNVEFVLVDGAGSGLLY